MKGICFEPGDLKPTRLVTVRRTAAIGDVIASTVVADKLAALGYTVTFQASSSVHSLLRRHKSISVVSDVRGRCDVNLDGVYENHPHRASLHFSEMFLSAANSQLGSRRITLGGNANCRPVLSVDPSEKEPHLAWLSRFPKPWVFICPRSQSWVNRTVPPRIWAEAARLMDGTKFWLGLDAAPSGIEKPAVNGIADLPLWIACADLMVTVDTGPMHIAAAVGTPFVVLEQSDSPELRLSDQRDFIVVRHPDLHCLNCQKGSCPYNASAPPCQSYPPELIADSVNRRLRSVTSEDVSAVITIYKPPGDRLRQCIEHVRPQVSEVIVTCEAAGVIPTDAPQGDGIRYVKHRQSDIGLSKNMNFGVRHANGKYLMLLNDDVYLRPDAVSRLLECMRPSVGMVGHLLFYPDGRIQHGGKIRHSGVRGWGHIDHLKHRPTIKFPTECENVTGASILVRRKAFYDAGGFDEEFFLYSEDDAFCLQIRQAGYKVLYTPHATAIHLEHQTTGQMGVPKHIQHGHAVFAKRWGWWMNKNLHTVPGRF